MHTSIMCINILQNIKAVGGDSRTNHVSISGRMNQVQLPVILRIFDENQNRRIHVYIFKQSVYDIIYLSNLLILSVP
jgi:hypothetical protein